MSLPLVHHSGNFDTHAVIAIVCSTLGLYNALELLVLIFMTFKQYKGLYFWSLLIASFGVIPYVIGWLITYFNLTHKYVGFIIDSYGWVTMVTGQSVVLYSRLHLVLKNENILRAVKWMIIFDAVVFHTMTTVVLYGSSYGDEQGAFNRSWNVIEKLQMTAFCVQEFIISGLYVWKTVRLLQIVKKKGTVGVMWQLFIINVIIIGMDIALLSLEYRDLLTMEQAFKVVIYSIKLKLEFAILNQLVELVQQNGRSLSDAMPEVDTYVDETKTKASSDLTVVASTGKSVEISSHLYWPDDLERTAVPHTGAVQHVETVEDGYGNQVHRGRTMSVEHDPHTIREQADSIRRDRRNRASDADLMYAGFMKSLSE
jgi:hypothetical protein